MNTESKTIKPYNDILLVEDDVRLSSLIAEYLSQNGLKVATQLRGDDAVDDIIQQQPDLVILDIMLPGLDGFEVCKQVRGKYSGPILMMTAKDEEIDQVVGLEIGADDYVVKPVQPRLLLARIRALLRRSAPLAETEKHQNKTANKLDFDSLVITKSSRSVTINTKSVELTTTEFDLLWLLASQAGEILSRDQISEALSGIEYDGLDRSIDIRISRLRKLLGDNTSKPQGIKTVRGQGYLFVADGWASLHSQA
ncbi:response regulator [Cocleimonas sp. KMM 6892]|uniref:response regulator n=1 Tax=unclassified Cocleimonas TaxID=2639732 RepID=UPI002DB78798|nr:MULTISPECIES: response regulator [unclassified Cocleimonas]MEB8433952.1 response regulator [Cocleimonas sp. KMM 6892]MEC4716763.1 response regulator [Cocleimonas sp. KMM 6895]MEC4746082.1 response regulator [Cocleimonas sp. KMM 6896]